MNFLQKKFWIAWSKFRFLSLPVERRVRLEVTTDGRHLTFLLTALGEAGYGVHVVGAPFIFRELMLLRKSVPLPFVIGGKERECGISITDQPSTLDSGLSTLFVLDYDYFSGLMERVEPRISRIYTDGQQGDAQGTCAGDAFSNPSTSELARASGNTSLTRSANNPALAYRAGELGSDGGNQPADSEVFLEGQSQAGLQTGNQKDRNTRAANDPSASRENSSSVSIRVISGKKTSTAPQALRMPYFMHPSVYHRGLHKRRSPSTALDSAAKRRRRFRLGFFGTHDREFYTKHYHFPGMNRFEILEVFLQKFGNSIKHLRGFPRDWDPFEMAVSIDSRGGDRNGKSFLSQEHYFEALRECDFVLSPPGWCMPVSHNLVEAMFCGAIPIINSGAFMAPPLENGANCLEFFGEVDFIATIEKALVLSDLEVEQMRAAVLEHYDRFLEPKGFVEELVSNESGRAFVNAEENSVRLVFPGMLFPWNVTAEARGII